MYKQFQLLMLIWPSQNLLLIFVVTEMGILAVFQNVMIQEKS